MALSNHRSNGANELLSRVSPPMTDKTPAVSLHGVTKRFGENVVAVDDVDLQIQDGEFFSLLGPSGCGKTTFLEALVADRDVGGMFRFNPQDSGDSMDTRISRVRSSTTELTSLH